MATPGKLHKKELKKQIPAKTSLNTPFEYQWAALPQKDLVFIQKTLESKLVGMGLKKKEEKVFRQWRKKKNKKPSTTSKVDILLSQDTQVQDPPKNGWTDINARKQLAIGINEVTKALERNEVRLVLICRSVKPHHMVKHLIVLSRTRHVPVCMVKQLSNCVSKPLGLKSVLALGFRHCASADAAFTDTVNAIIPRVPSLDVAWLRGTGPSGTTEEPEEMEEDAAERRGQKRKLEGESDEIPESSSCILQPLKVKKIIPNPSKKRTQKKKKAKTP
ncbi:ribonuclease P protein subunit p38 [Polymixia lowei]